MEPKTIQIRHEDKRLFFKQGCQAPHTTISELHRAYNGIMEGYEFEIIGSDIIIRNVKNGIDYKKIKDKFNKGTASRKEVQSVLKDLI